MSEKLTLALSNETHAALIKMSRKSEEPKPFLSNLTHDIFSNYLLLIPLQSRVFKYLITDGGAGGGREAERERKRAESWREKGGRGGEIWEGEGEKGGRVCRKGEGERKKGGGKVWGGRREEGQRHPPVHPSLRGRNILLYSYYCS